MTQMRARNRWSKGNSSNKQYNFKIEWKYGIRKELKTNPSFLTWVRRVKNWALYH